MPPVVSPQQRVRHDYRWAGHDDLGSLCHHGERHHHVGHAKVVGSESTVKIATGNTATAKHATENTATVKLATEMMRARYHLSIGRGELRRRGGCDRELEGGHCSRAARATPLVGIAAKRPGPAARAVASGTVIGVAGAMPKVPARLIIQQSTSRAWRKMGTRM